MEIFNRRSLGNALYILRSEDIEELELIHKALRYYKIVGGHRNMETLNHLLNEFDKFHRQFNAKKYASLLAFS